MELEIAELSSSTGQAVRILDPWRFKGLGAASWQDVLWTNSSGSTLIVESPPGTDPAGHWITRAIGPVPGVLTGGRFTPLPRAPQNLHRRRLVGPAGHGGPPAGSARPGPRPCLLPCPRRQLAGPQASLIREG